jgi:hypothetical protein
MTTTISANPIMPPPSTNRSLDRSKTPATQRGGVLLDIPSCIMLKISAQAVVDFLRADG